MSDDYDYDDELKLVGILILDDLPDFELKTEVTENVQLEEILENDKDLSQALHAIDEEQNDQENNDIIANDMSHARDQSSRFTQLDDEEKENIVTETESTDSTKRQVKHGVKILPFGDLLCVLYRISDIFLLV